MTVTDPLARPVGVTLPMAVQAIAALEERIREYQGYAIRGADVQFVIRDSQALVAELRSAFHIWPMTEDELDALHEQAVAESEARAAAPDVPLAIAGWAPGEYEMAWGK